MLPELAQIVKDVGNQLLKWRNGGAIEGKWYDSQFKAKADLLAHKVLIDKLRILAPQIPVISEEDPVSLLKKRPDCYWLIDPIDGTASFAYGYPGFVTQVALVMQNSPSLAAIYAPALDALYLAERGSGAFLNGKRLYCSQHREPETLIDNYPEPRGVTLLAYKALNFKRYLECGSISLKICKVAESEADLFFKDVTVRDWDLAAPQVVLEEAGGLLTDVHGYKIEYIGSYEKNGLVAASSEKISVQLTSWYANFVEENQ